jgi:hypothetical protein
MYQESHASEGSQQEALAAFKVLQEEINAQVYISITNEGLRYSWLQQQIDELNGN